MISRRGSRVLGAVLLLLTADVSAAERPGSVYATGGVVVPYQEGPHGEALETYETAPGGTTVGWLVGGGVFVAPAASIDVELARTGLMVAREPSRYGMTFNEERRDRVVAVGLRLHVPVAAGIRFEPLVGIAATHHAAWFRTEYDPALSGGPAVDAPRQAHDLPTQVGVSFGCDLRLGGRRFAVLPSLRVSATGVSHGSYIKGDPDREIGAIFPGGYPRWTIRPGVGLRVDF